MEDASGGGPKPALSKWDKFQLIDKAMMEQRSADPSDTSLRQLSSSLEMSNLNNFDKVEERRFSSKEHTAFSNGSLDNQLEQFSITKEVSHVYQSRSKNEKKSSSRSQSGHQEREHKKAIRYSPSRDSVAQSEYLSGLISALLKRYPPESEKKELKQSAVQLRSQSSWTNDLRQPPTKKKTLKDKEALATPHNVEKESQTVVKSTNEYQTQTEGEADIGVTAYAPYHSPYAYHTPYAYQNPYTHQDPYAYHSPHALDPSYTPQGSYTPRESNILRNSYTHHDPDKPLNLVVSGRKGKRVDVRQDPPIERRNKYDQQRQPVKPKNNQFEHRQVAPEQRKDYRRLGAASEEKRKEINMLMKEALAVESSQGPTAVKLAQPSEDLVERFAGLLTTQLSPWQMDDVLGDFRTICNSQPFSRHLREMKSYDEFLIAPPETRTSGSADVPRSSVVTSGGLQGFTVRRDAADAAEMERRVEKLGMLRSLTKKIWNMFTSESDEEEADEDEGEQLYDPITSDFYRLP